MTTYEIKAAKASEDAIYTEVEFIFDGGKPVLVSIPHARPPSVEDVLQGIVNRAASEAAKLDAGLTCEEILKGLEIGKVVEIK